MSTQKVFVRKIEQIMPHKNADRLELAVIGGWQVVVGKGIHEAGDLVAYVEIGTCLPVETSDKYHVTQYLKTRTDRHGNKVAMVQQVKLRGEPSFGICLPPPEGCVEFDDVTDYFQAFKFEAQVEPIKTFSAQQERDYGTFYKYTDIENLRTYSDVFTKDDDVVYLTKIHGSNIRVGIVMDDGKFKLCVGSRRVNIREDETNAYWKTVRANQSLLDMLKGLHGGDSEVIIYGELTHTQKNFTYGSETPEIIVFDISVNGLYYSWPYTKSLCEMFGVSYAKELYVGKYDFAKILELDKANLKSVYDENHIEEGIVVKPLVETTHPKIGRKILKFVFTNYLLSKGAMEMDTTDI